MKLRPRQAEPKASDAPRSLARTEGAKILLIDDSEVCLEVVSSALLAHGYQVICLSSPTDFFRILHETRPDLVLVDVMMPGIKGNRLAALAAGQGSKDRRLSCPIVLFSDLPESQLKELASECGAAGYLMKSSTHQSVARAVGRFLDPISINRA